MSTTAVLDHKQIIHAYQNKEGGGGERRDGGGGSCVSMSHIK